MLKKYTDFISESIEFIIESDVIYSNKFRLALNKIESPISKSLLDIENRDFNVQSNFFDVNLEKNDTVSFTPDRKAQEILGDTKELYRFVGSGGGWLRHSDSNKFLFDKLGYTFDEGTEPYKPNSRDIGEVLGKVTSDESGRVYLWIKWKGGVGTSQEGVDLGQGVYNQDKLTLVDSSEALLRQVWSKNRQELKVGRAIRALLKVAKVDFVDKDIESFVNQYKAFIDKLNDKFSLFDIVKEEEIGYWYNYSRYYERKGTLGQSCMSNVPTRYFDIYMKNPEVCSLVIFRSIDDNDKIVGRALLWKLRDGKEFLDRIYTINDSDVQLFKDYAKEMGWYTKYYNSSSDSNQAISPDGNTVRLDLVVDIKKGMYDAYPYLDTLKYWEPSKGTLSVNKTYDSYTLEDTGGEYMRCELCDGSGRATCTSCDGDGDYECYECDGYGTEDCNNCDGEGDLECPECDGNGHVDGEDGEEDCDNCNASGKIECNPCDGRGKVDCSYCDGDGRRTCGECDGDGVVDCPEC